MEFIIMCGGKYSQFTNHKALTVINGEALVERTIRLLRENGITDISISSNNPAFDIYDVPRLEHTNTFDWDDSRKPIGYWLDAYYPTNEPVTYLHGDVYYSENAIKRIINLNPSVNTFIGNELARNKEHHNWGEPFGYIVVNQKEFQEGINKTKKLQDEGKLERGYAISWELYRVLNGLDPNKQYINDDTYLSIDDITSDIDYPYQIEILNKKVRGE